MKIRQCAQFAVGFMAVFTFTGCSTETRQLAHDSFITSTASPAVPADVSPAVPSPQQKPAERPGTSWETNAEALEIIEEAEGLRLRAYRLAGQWLIGYGHATDDQSDAAQHLVITEYEAKQLLKADVRECEEAVARVIKVPMTRNQFSAMVALCYNVGQSMFANSSIAAHINNGDELNAADAFLLYDSARIKDEKVECASLIQRRIKERYLFLAS